MSEKKKSDDGITGPLLLGIVLILSAICFGMYSTKSDASEGTPVPITAADDATAIAGTIPAYVEPSVTLDVTPTDDDGFIGTIEDGACTIAIKLNSEWDLSLVQDFVREHNCDVSITEDGNLPSKVADPS